MGNLEGSPSTAPASTDHLRPPLFDPTALESRSAHRRMRYPRPWLHRGTPSPIKQRLPTTLLKAHPMNVPPTRPSLSEQGRSKPTPSSRPPTTASRLRTMTALEHIPVQMQVDWHGSLGGDLMKSRGGPSSADACRTCIRSSPRVQRATGGCWR